MEFLENIKNNLRLRGETQEWLADQLNENVNTVRGWFAKSRAPGIDTCVKIADILDVSLDNLTNRTFIRSAGSSRGLEEQTANSYAVASLVPQKVSAGFGQQLLDYAPEDLAQRAPYPKKWGNGLLAIEVMGDSMTGVQIFDGDLVYFKPGEIRGDGIYVLQVNGDVLVKRVSFDSLNRKLVISSENPRYPQQVEPQDSQAITILGKVKGWLHEHVY